MSPPPRTAADRSSLAQRVAALRAAWAAAQLADLESPHRLQCLATLLMSSISRPRGAGDVAAEFLAAAGRIQQARKVSRSAAPKTGPAVGR